MDERIIKGKLTKERRKKMCCQTFELKLDRSHMSKATKNKLEKLYYEAKWYYNYCLSQEDFSQIDTKLKSVPVKTPHGYEDLKLEMLSAQMKQSLMDRLFISLKSLSALKKKGEKVGRLKYRSRIDSIPLTNQGYLFKNGKLQILKFKKTRFRVSGLEQIPEGAELGSANLVRRGKDYYLIVTVFTPKIELDVPDASIGIDAGCSTQLTFSDGTKVEYGVEPTKKLKRLDKKITRNDRPESKKKSQDRMKRRAEYRRMTNKKNDMKKKIVHAITTTHKYVCYQKESIKAWQAGGHGKKIQNTAIGGLMSDLKKKSHTPIEVSRWFPSTQLCPACGSRYKPTLSERTYVCPECGYTEDRDVKAALCIEEEGMKRVPVDRRDFKAGESQATALFNILSGIPGVRVSKPGSLSQVSRTHENALGRSQMLPLHVDL